MFSPCDAAVLQEHWVSCFVTDPDVSPLPIDQTCPPPPMLPRPRRKTPSSTVPLSQRRLSPQQLIPLPLLPLKVPRWLWTLPQ